MRPKRTRMVDHWAECCQAGCGWNTSGPGSTGRAAQHYDRTNHRTLFHWSVAGQYGEGPMVDALDYNDDRQATLDVEGGGSPSQRA